MGKTSPSKPMARRQREQTPASGSAATSSKQNWISWLTAALLLFSTLAVYWQVTHFELVDVDDPDYVIHNTYIREGLTGQGVAWAFNLGYAANWHPLTWLSHMLDCQLYGMNPGELHGTGGHHLTSVLLHLASALLLFLILKRMTSSVWRSGFVAALFALHPLHVESVAWVAERKDVLSTFFLMLTLWAYARYAAARQSPGAKGQKPGAGNFLFYGLSLFFFACGLMSKQMLVSAPFLLLLLDYWPLGRLNWNRPGRDLGKLIGEKIPFFILAMIASLVVIAAQSKGGALTTVSRIPFAARVPNAIVTYIVYLIDMVVPRNLAHYYPHEGVSWSSFQIGASALLLALITWAVLAQARKHPFLLVGWFWYLLTLVPVIGLVQIGAQARADRYTYIPLIGIFIMLAQGVPALFSRWQNRFAQPVLGVASLVAVAALLPLTYAQVGYWQNSARLYAHTLSVTRNNWFVHSAMAAILNSEATALRFNGHIAEADKKNQEAIKHLRVTLQLMPGMVDAHTCLANSLLDMGKTDEAIAEYSQALELSPKNALTRGNLGNAFVRQGKIDSAIEQFRAALEIDPAASNTHYNLAVALERQNQLTEALAEYRKTLELFPGDLTAYWACYQMGNLLFRAGQKAEAIDAYKKAVEINSRSKVDEVQQVARRALERLNGG